GKNFGWNAKEGLLCTDETTTCDPLGDFTDPIYDYEHEDGCSITGGYVYRGEALPELQGTYVFGDFCSGVIKGLRLQEGGWEVVGELPTELPISTFGENEDGELYVVGINGVMYELAPLVTV